MPLPKPYNRVAIQRGRGSGKTLALQMIAIGEALRDAGNWVTFFDHYIPERGQGRRFALFQADSLRLTLIRFGIKGVVVRTSGNLVQVRFDLPSGVST